MKKVLFVSPFMGRTGSEISVLNIINNCKLFKPYLYSGNNGPLLKDIKGSIPAYISPLTNLNKNRIQRINKRLGLKTPLEKYFEKVIREVGPDLVFLNTISNSDFIRFLDNKKLPFALWAHELFSSFDFLKEQEVEILLNQSRFIAGCSSSVCELFIKAGAKNVILIPEVIDIQKIDDSLLKPKPPSFIKYHYKHCFAMSGKIGYRKGIQFVPEIAKKLKSINSCFIWIGSGNEYGLEKIIKSQLKSDNLDNVFFTGEQNENYYQILNSCDFFILSSIEDPYPLVMLEAAYLQKPIISFKSGGVEEFVKPGMGRVVPLFDINSLFAAIDDAINGRLSIDTNLLKLEAVKHDIKHSCESVEKTILSYL